MVLIIPIVPTNIIIPIPKTKKILPNFAFVKTIYCTSIEEALKRARRSAQLPGRHYGGITLPSGRRGFAVYEGGSVVEQYSYCDAPRRQ